MVVDTTAKFPMAADAPHFMHKLNMDRNAQREKRRNSDYAHLPPKKKMCLDYIEQGATKVTGEIPNRISDYLQPRQDEVIVIDADSDSPTMDLKTENHAMEREDAKLEVLNLSKPKQVRMDDFKLPRSEVESFYSTAQSKPPPIRTVLLPICIPVPVVNMPGGYSNPMDWARGTTRRHSAPASSLYMSLPGGKAPPRTEFPAPLPPAALHQPLRSPGWNEARYHHLLPGSFSREMPGHTTAFWYPPLPSQLTGTTLPGAYHREMPPPLYRPVPRSPKAGFRIDQLPSRLPFDPRDWTKAQVHQWLGDMSAKFKLPSATPDRFPMNGKGVNMMTLAMFLDRVPRGGRVLYNDFSRRVIAAMAQGPLVRAASA